MVEIARHPTPAGSAASRWGFVAGLLVLATVTLLTFWQVLAFDFVRWDDDINITQNPLLTSPWSREICWRFFDADQALRFKPLHWLLDRWVYNVWGFQPQAWHALNLLLHVVATVLFCLVLRRVLQLTATKAGDSRINAIALLAAAIWGLHPLRAETVAWATASTYPFTAIWLLGSFVCYLEATATGTLRRAWLVPAWLLAVAAYASYPVALGYGLFLMVIDAWWRVQGGGAAAGRAAETSTLHWRRSAMFLLPAFIAAGFTLWSRFARPGIFVEAPTVEAVGWASRAAMALATQAFLAWRLLWPFNLTPNVPPIVFGESRWQVLSLAFVALAVLIFAWRRRQEHPGLAVVVWGFAAISLPCLGLTERPTWPVDRYGYVAHLPLMAGGAVWIALWSRTAGTRWLAAAAGMAVATACAVGAMRQTLIWRDSPALFAAMENDPHFAENPRQQGHVYILWARDEAGRGRSARAAELFNRAQQVYLAAIRAAVARADYTEALALSTHVERHFPLTAVMRRERGAWLLRLARFPEARGELQRAEADLPGDERVAALWRETEQAAAALRR